MRLEADGIPAFIADDQFVWMKWPISTALGGVRVGVPNGYGEDANVALARCASGEYQAELAAMFGGVDELDCPRCGSTSIRRRPSAGEILFGVVCLLLFGVAVKVDPRRCTCRVCGWRWSDMRYDA